MKESEWICEICGEIVNISGKPSKPFGLGIYTNEDQLNPPDKKDFRVMFAFWDSDRQVARAICGHCLCGRIFA